jgi:hypothetical protein
MLDPWDSGNTAANGSRATESEWHAWSADNHSRHTGDAADTLPVPVATDLCRPVNASLGAYRMHGECCSLERRDEGLHQLMPTLIAQPTRISAAGNKPKLIDEYIGRVNSKTSTASVAHMRSPEGWIEPGQAPECDEFTIVLKGMLRVEHKQGWLDVHSVGDDAASPSPM